MPIIKINLYEKADYHQFIRDVKNRIPSGQTTEFIKRFWPDDSISMYFKLRNYLNGNSYRNGIKYDLPSKLEEYFKAQGIDLTEINQ